MPVFGTSSSLSASGYGFGRSLQSYEISPSTTYVNEGSSVTFTIEAVGVGNGTVLGWNITCLLYTSPSPRDYAASRMPSSA